MQIPMSAPVGRGLEDGGGEVSDCLRAEAAEDVEVAMTVIDDSESVVVSRGIVCVMNVVSRGADETGSGLGMNPGTGA